MEKSSVISQKNLRLFVRQLWLVGEATRQRVAARRPLSVQSKGDSAVTTVDLQNQRRITALLQQFFPQAYVVGEEDKRAAAVPETAQIVAYVDPLDGTYAYVAGMAELFWSIMVGIVVGNAPSLGFIYDPTTRQVFYGGADTQVVFRYDGLRHRLYQVVPSARPVWGTDHLYIRDNPSLLYFYEVLATAQHKEGGCGYPVLGPSGFLSLLLLRGNLRFFVGGRSYRWDLLPIASLLAPSGGGVQYLAGGEVDWRATPHAPLEPIVAGESPAIIKQVRAVYPY